MREIPCVGPFDAVINVGSSFGFFEAEAEDQKVLESVSGVLAPGGRLLLEMGNREYLLKNFEPQGSREDADGSTIEIQRSFDFVRSRIDATFRRSAAGSSPETWSHSWRAYTLAEVARHALVRELRLAALREAPGSFAQSAGDTAGRPESCWVDLSRSDKHALGASRQIRRATPFIAIESWIWARVR